MGKERQWTFPFPSASKAALPLGSPPPQGARGPGFQAGCEDGAEFSTRSSGWPVDQTSDLIAPSGVHQVFIEIKGALSEEAGRLGWRESCLGVLVAGGTLLLAGLELKAPGTRGLGLR